MKLYRPVGINELRLIYTSGMAAFPPRLPDQPIFYPVLNYGYAEQIARDWNAASDRLAGYVTEFDVDDEYAARFERRVVGAARHEELWVPAGELEEFNGNLQGAIEVTGAYFGAGFRGAVPEEGVMAGCDADAQLALLTQLHHRSPEAFENEVRLNHVVIFLHYPYWSRGGDESSGILAALREAWGAFGFPPLPAAD